MSSELEYLNEITDSFIRAIHNVLGGDKSTAAVEALKPVLGKAWRDGLILRKLSQAETSGRRIRFTIKDKKMVSLPGDQYVFSNYPTVPKKITAIKALRGMTGLGLVDAKNLIEASYDSWRYAGLTTPVNPNDEEMVANNHRNIQNYKAELEEAGWHVLFA